MAVNYGPSIVTNGLFLLVDAANPRSYPGSGTAWNDLSGAGNNGTLQAAPTFSSGNGGYFSFNGTSQFVSTTTPLITTTTTPYSVGVWFQTNTASGQKIIGFDLSQVTANNTEDRNLWVGTNGSLWFSQGQTMANVTTTSSVVTNTWSYAVGTFSGTTQSLYLNGNLIGSNAATPTGYTGWWKIAYGSHTGWPSTGTNPGFWTGNIGAVQIYTVSLTQGQVTQNFNAHRGRFGI